MGGKVATRDIVVIGASAGGIETLIKLFRLLPKEFPASVFATVHIPADSPSNLPQILSSAGSLPAIHPKDGEQIRRGQIYVAPPNRHLLLRKNTVHLGAGPRENRHRPSIDALFRSAAKFYTTRVIGIVMSGMLDDGSGGLVTIRRRGGICIVQDPKEALFDQMPLSAIEATTIDHVLTIPKIAELLEILVRQTVTEEEDLPMQPDEENGERRGLEGRDGELPGTPASFNCPECGGSLWEREEDNLLQYRCHVGHTYSSQTLVEENSEDIEAALWTALRVLQERVSMCRRLADRAREREQTTLARLEEEAQDAARRAELLRSILNQGKLDSHLAQRRT